MKPETINKLIVRHTQELDDAIARKVDVESVNLIKANLDTLYRKKKENENKPPVDVAGIIKQLKEMDFTIYPEGKVRPLINELIGVFPSMMSQFLYPGAKNYIADSFVRARPYSDGDAQFCEPHELSFVPPHKNKSFRRASTPNQTMFYGCLKRIGGEEIKTDNQFVASMEALHFLSDKKSIKIKRVAYGKWEVTDRLNLIAILNHKEFHSKITHIKKMYESFVEYYSDLEMKDDAIAISDFISDCYADEHAGEGKEYLYMISALWTEAILRDRRIDGVLYPSVRTIGDGICVALRPKSCGKLKLVVAGEGLVYKAPERALIDAVAVTKVEDGAKSFKMKHLESKVELGICDGKIIIDAPKQ